MATRIMIVEDEALFREMLRISLSTQPQLEVIGSAANGAAAIKMAQELAPDVILMDIELGDGPSGIEAGIRIRAASPGVGIVLLSMHKDKEYLRSIPPEQAGGWSYLLKNSVADVATLTRAVEGAASGLVVLDPELVTALRPKPDTGLEGLTQRQRDVIELMAQGYGNGAIAGKLQLGEKSVENYINAIYQQLGITREEKMHPRVKAVLLYLEQSRH